MKLFIPLTDELIFEHPEWICGPCVPFSHDYECYHWLIDTDTEGKSDREASHE